MRRTGTGIAIAAALAAITPAPAAAASSPRATVREYVRALNDRDRQGFCATLAPWTRARVGAFLKSEPSPFMAAVHESRLCPEAARFIGFAGEGSSERWEHADVLRLSRSHRLGTIVAVDLKVVNHFVPYESQVAPRPAHTTIQHDRVYLVRDPRGWRVATLSALADTAAIGLIADPGPRTRPPDLGAERRWYRRQLARDHAAVRRERSTAGGPYADCSKLGAAQTLADPRGDIDDTWNGPTAWPPWTDLLGVSVARADGALCIDFDLAADARHRTFFTVTLDASDAGSANLEAIRLSATRAVVALGDAAVPARLGVRGRRLSIVIRRDSLAQRLRALLESRVSRVEALWQRTGPHFWQRGPGPQYVDEIAR